MMRKRSPIKIFILMFMLLFAPRVIRSEIAVFEAKLDETMDAVLLPVTINGNKFLFLFDSGSTLTVLDKSLEHFLGEPLQIRQNAETPANAMALSYFKPIDVMLGELNLKTRFPFLTADLKFASKVLGHDFHGVIGMSFIHKYIWKLDFEQRIISALSSDYSANSGKYDVSIDIYPTPRGEPAIMIELSGKNIPFIIDTGDTGSGGLSKDVIDLLAEQNLISNIATDMSVYASGGHITHRVRVNHFKIGDLEYNNLLMFESKLNNIGLRLLKRHTSILDFPNKRLYLRKGKCFTILDKEDKSGIKIINGNGNIIIEYLDKRSPSAAAGLKKGDVIKSINGMAFNGNDLLQVRDLLKGEDGKEILMQVDRNGKGIETRFSLKSGYDYL